MCEGARSARCWCLTCFCKQMLISQKPQYIYWFFYSLSRDIRVHYIKISSFYLYSKMLLISLYLCVWRCQECGVLVSDLTKHRNLRHDPTSKIIISDLEPDVVRQDGWDLETIDCQNQCCGFGSIGSVCFWVSRIWIRILLSSSKIARKTLFPTNL